MCVDDFELTVVPGYERYDGTVEMPHEQTYQVKLRNFSLRRADVELTIDGKDMGTYRIEGHGCVLLERAAHDHGKFTFFRSDSAAAAAVGAAKLTSAQRGLVQARFKPEAENVTTISTRRDSKGMPESFVLSRGFGFDARREVSGVTGLTGHSAQRFQTVENLRYLPESQWVTISLRLFAVDGPRELQAAPAARGNPVPAPVD